MHNNILVHTSCTWYSTYVIVLPATRYSTVGPTGFLGLYEYVRSVPVPVLNLRKYYVREPGTNKLSTVLLKKFENPKTSQQKLTAQVQKVRKLKVDTSYCTVVP